MLTGTRPYETRPDWNPDKTYNPVLGTSAVNIGQVFTQGGIVNPGNMTVVPYQGPYPLYGSFVVSNNTFTTGNVQLIVGPYTFLNGSDYQVGAAASDTATNIAAAISNFTGVSATAVGTTVTVYGGAGHADIVEFRAVQHGTTPNFSSFNPSNGFLGSGSGGPPIANPYAGPPILTKILY